MSLGPIVLKIVNLLAYFFLLGSNVYSTLGPDNGHKSPYHENHDTFITPAPFTFGVWGLIHFLLGGFVIYQFFNSATETVVDGIQLHFIAISLWNTAWLALWVNNYLIIAWIFIIITAFQVSYVYYTLKYKYSSQSLNDTLWIHAPFSLYHAWIFVLVVISTFAAFTPDKTEDNNEPSLLVKILVVIGLFVLETTAVGYIEKFKGDIAGAIVIAWSLYGIAFAQEDFIIHWTALVLGIITTLHILKPFYLKYFLHRGAENAPLLG